MRVHINRKKLRGFVIAALFLAALVLMPCFGLYRLVLASAHQASLGSVFVTNVIYRDEAYWCLNCKADGKRLGLRITLTSFDVEPVEGLRFQCFRAERLIDNGMMELRGQRMYLEGACTGPLQARTDHIRTAYEQVGTAPGEKYSAVYGILVSPQSHKVLVVWSDDVVQFVETDEGPFRGYASEKIEWNRKNYDRKLPKLSLKPPFVTMVPGYHIWKSRYDQIDVYDGTCSFLVVRRDCPLETYVSRVDVLDDNDVVIFSYSP
jgi:hypothetical protein